MASGSYLDDVRPGALPPRRREENRPGMNGVTVVLVTILCIGIVYGLCMLLVSSVIGGGKDHVIATQKRILYATDPTALSEAIQQLAKMKPGIIDPASPTVPGIIHRVDPKTITITEQMVTLECTGGSHRFGVAAMVDKNATVTPPMAVRELAPRVWYYSEDGSAPPP